MDTGTLKYRIHTNPQLKALWGQTDGVDGPVVPRETEAMNRPIDVLPEMSVEGVELAQMVSESDNEILRKGLAKLGVSETMIKRLKTLDGLAKSGGHFLSISLEKTHRLYFLQVVHLHEVTDLVRHRLMAKPGEDGHIASDETRAYFTRNYVELVKEGGSAYKLMMEGASNMVRMLQAAKGGDDETPGATGKPKWGRVRTVKDANAKD